jgi:dephospho-CoA kinase
MKKGYCVALTGGIACGKTTVAGFWRRWGAEMLDADEIAHRLIAPGGVCVEAVQQAFGPRVWAPDGGIDRSRLAAIVFADAGARQRLNGLLHPPVIRRMRVWADGIRREGLVGVAVIPLLFEAGLEKEWDAVVCVASDEETMLARLEKRGLSPKEAQARIDSQWPLSKKMARSTRVIENNGSLAELETQSRAVWEDLIEQGE